MAGGQRIASAYVSVVPKMEGFGNISKALGAAGSSGGANFKRGVVSASSGTGEMAGEKVKSGFSAKMVAIGNIASQAFAKVGSVIVSRLSDAIDRVDTLNNFPRIMQNLGYSASDASESINRLASGVQGLPTSLDSIAQFTKRIAPVSGSLKNATDIALAFNDALLAGGASTDLQTNAMEQYAQMLSTGKVDMMAWRSVVNAMPGQVNQLAESLLGAGRNSQDLYNAMRDGTVSFDDFNNAMINLDKNGINGFASFSDQAKGATSGIGTALDNVGNRINQAIGKIIQAIGPENISGAINAFSSAFGPIADGLIGLAPVIAAVTGGFIAFKAVMVGMRVISAVSTAIGTLTTVIKLLGESESITNGITQLLNGTMAANPAFKIAIIVAALVAAIIYLWNTNEGFRNAVIGIWNGIKAAFGSAFSFIQQLFSTFSAIVQPVISWLATNIGGLVGRIVAWAQYVWSYIQMAMNFIRGIISAVIGVIVSIFQAKFNAIKTVVSVVFNGIKAVISGVMSVIQSIISGAIGVIKGIFNGIRVIGSIVSSVFNTVKNAMTSPVKTAAGVIKGIINKIKGFFNFKVSTPHIPIPHFSIQPEGWKVGDLLKGKIPTLGIKWYASGGVFSSPSLIGVGDASSPEIITPQAMMADTFQSVLASQQSDASLLSEVRSLRGDLDSLKVYLDTGELVGGIARESKRVSRMYGA